MPKRKVNAAQQREIYRLLETRLDIPSVHKILTDTFPDEAIAASTLYKYRKSYKRNVDEFTLDQISDLGFADQINLRLIELWGEMAAVSEDGTTTWPFKSGSAETLLTLGEARWYGKLLPVIESMELQEPLSKSDVFLLSLVCDSRERIAAALKQKPDFNDVMAYLSFKPWVDEENHFFYMRAINAGNIPALEYVELMAVALSKVSGGDHLSLRQRTPSAGLPMLFSDYPADFLDAVGKPVGPFPSPMKLLAWAKLSFFHSNLDLPDGTPETDARLDQGSDSFVASDESRDSWYWIPPFVFEYSSLESISLLINYDSVDQDKDLLTKACNELTELVRHLPEPPKSQIEGIVKCQAIS